MSAQLDTLTAALAQPQTDLAALLTGIGLEVTALQAQIAALQAANPAIDLTASIASVNSIDAAIKAAIPASLPTPAVK